MALIAEFNKTTKERQSVHGTVECEYSVFQDGSGKTYLQLETFGSKERQIPGKVSQSIQLNETAAAQLKRIIDQTFPKLR